MQRTKAVSIYFVIGILILGSAVFARQLGLDPNPSWGKGRTALLIFGFLVMLFPWAIEKRFPLSERRTGTDLFALPVLLLVIGIYLWFASVSRDLTSNYYSLLAGSFRNGELSLPLNPDPALLALPNPYDPAARQGIRVPMDLSLYNGKFYLYWGPAPSLLLMFVQPFFSGKIGEAILLLLFMCGIFLSQFVLIVLLWQRFFPQIPRWMLLLSIALAGIANPALWLLTQPKIYEAAIAGAQFFFIAGLAAAILSLDRQPVSRWGLALAGTLWALAVGTRSVAVFPVVFMTLLVVFLLFKLHGRSRLRLFAELLSLGLPLFLGALAFCWYNWARFGSLLETGFTYQLAAPYLQQHLDELFLPAYTFQNLYNYLLHPFAVQPPFPFLHPIRGITRPILPWPVLPELYSAQAITGILCAVPFVIFAILPTFLLMKRLFRKTPADSSNNPPQTGFPGWITTSLLGSFLFSFIAMIVFFWAAMRYAEDFMPELILLSILGFWQGYQLLPQTGKQGTIYAALGITLAGVSMMTAILLALSIYFSRGLL